MNKKIEEISSNCARAIIKEIDKYEMELSDQEFLTILLGSITRIILTAKNDKGLELLKATSEAFALSVEELIKTKDQS